MITPTSAPAMVPERETVLARYPSHAVIALMPTAHGSADATALREADRAASVIRLPSHRTSAAVAGTEMLSSSLTGIVSTIAATSAATSGAAIVNAIGGVGVI